MKTDTKTTSENQRDVTNHGKKPHEIKPENDFLRGQTIDTTHENGHEDDFQETLPTMGRQPTKPNEKPIFRGTKNRYD